MSSFARIDDLRARAVIQIDASAFVGDREVLSYDPAGESLGVVRLQKLLEAARDDGLRVAIHLDSRGCLAFVDICR